MIKIVNDYIYILYSFFKESVHHFNILYKQLVEVKLIKLTNSIRLIDIFILLTYIC